MLKLVIRLFIAVIALTTTLGAVAEEQTAEQRLAANFSYILGVQAANNLRKQLPQALGDIDLEAMMRGVRDRLEGREPRMDVAEMTFWSGKFLQMLEERRKSLGTRNAAEGDAYRDEYAGREGVVKAQSGMLYRELRPGAGKQPGIGQKVRFHYKGAHLNGQVFDSSYTREAPVSASIREIIHGWQEALTLMQVGAKWQVVLPPELAYGKAGNSVVGPSETLVFDIELLGIE